MIPLARCLPVGRQLGLFQCAGWSGMSCRACGNDDGFTGDGWRTGDDGMRNADLSEMSFITFGFKQPCLKR